MKSYWTEDEKRLRSEIGRGEKYPRWKNCASGSLYYVHSNLWAEEVFKHRDGTWQAGLDKDARFFRSMQEAVDYAERLAQPRVSGYYLNQERIRRAILKRTRLAGATMNLNLLPDGLVAKPFQSPPGTGGIKTQTI